MPSLKSSLKKKKEAKVGSWMFSGEARALGSKRNA